MPQPIATFIRAVNGSPLEANKRPRVNDYFSDSRNGSLLAGRRGSTKIDRAVSIFFSAASTIAHAKRVSRCPWAIVEPNITYHDQEWGVPLHDDRALFEFLILEGAQAGLSWITILKKRQHYRKAFDGFRAEKIARYGARDVKRLLGDAGIVRNRLKIAATIQNAKAFLAVRKELGTFDSYLWSFVGGKPKQNRWRTMAQLPARTAESDAMSRDLMRRGFKFVGSTICYALMQATGMVNDHLVTCPRHAKLGRMRRRK
jgi:DNA-3-methyladenine glycosylase I